MPALPSVPQVIRITQKGLLGEDLNVVNRFFMNYSGGPPNGTDLNSMLTAADAAWAAHMAAHIMAGYALEEWTAEDLTSPTGAVGSIPSTHAGSDSGVTNTAALAFILQFKIARRYRGGHPRMYVAGVSPGHLTDDQKWDTSFASGLVAAWIAFISAIVSGGPYGATIIGQVNVSYYEGFHNFTFPSGRSRPIPTLRGSPLVDTVNFVGNNPRPGSQRRRNLQGS